MDAHYWGTEDREGERVAGENYQIQASAPSNSFNTFSGYKLKSSKITTLSLGLSVTEAGRGRRERATRDVMPGWSRHWERTSWPMKPVEPVRISFMVGDNCVGRAVGEC